MCVSTTAYRKDISLTHLYSDSFKDLAQAKLHLTDDAKTRTAHDGMRSNGGVIRSKLQSPVNKVSPLHRHQHSFDKVAKRDASRMHLYQDRQQARLRQTVLRRSWASLWGAARQVGARASLAPVAIRMRPALGTGRMNLGRGEGRWTTRRTTTAGRRHMGGRLRW